MASLTLSVGQQSVSVQMPDAKALVFINDVVAATGGPVDGTSRQKGLWVLRQIAQELRTVQRRAIEQRKEAAIRAELTAELEATGDWVDV